MIQFNLLPDIKVEYIKAAHTKRTAIVISTIVITTVIAVVVLTALTVTVFQKQHIDHLTGDIKDTSRQLENMPDINKILTVQNQLNSLPALHEKKPLASRMFSYLTQLTPSDVSLKGVELSQTDTSIILSGNTDAISKVNKFADALKFTKYELDGAESEQKNAFYEVVLSSFAREEQTGVTYELSFKYDPLIFDGTRQVKLIVPNIITTRSEIEKPSALFESGEE